jgi:tetratricopeptide (TPR) repeat protein
MMGPSEQRLRGIVLMALLTAAHTAGWVGVNAGSGSSLLRFDTLLDFRFISPRAMAIAFEEVGGYRRARGDLLGAADAYARCVVLDSTSARRWTLFANAEGLQGNIGVARDAYERAVALGSMDPEVYLNLGIILYDQGQLDAGLREVGEAAAIDSLDPVVSFTLGRMLFEGRKDLTGALPWFERTIRLAPGDSIARSYADRCRAHIVATPPTHVPGVAP